MGIKQDDVLSLQEGIDNLFYERARACDYYSSKEYAENISMAVKLGHEIVEHLGKGEGMWELFSKYEDLYGQQLGSLSESCYRRGFADALRLAREIDQVSKGLSSEMIR